MKNQILVLSFDLGSNLGWSKNVCTIRPDVSINVIDHGTIYLDQLANRYMKTEYNEIYSRHRIRMIVFEEVIRKLVNSMKFDSFVTEDIFCMPNRVTAFRSLAIYMESLERIINIEKHQRLYAIPPNLIKKHISDYGLQDKIKVQNSISENINITIKKPENMTNHETDSIAGCWAFLKEYLLAPI